MKKRKLGLLALLIGPWLTVPFLGKNAFKKYLPAAIFIVTLTKALDLFGENKKWWRFYKGIPPFNSMNFFIFGPYFVTSLWILRMTYQKFPLYILSNTILHIIYTIIGSRLLKHYKIASLVKVNKVQYTAMNFARAVLLYGFQYITSFNHDKKTYKEN